MVKKEIEKFKFVKKEGGLESTPLTNVNYSGFGYELVVPNPMELPSGSLAYLNHNYTGVGETTVTNTTVTNTIQSQVNQMVTFNSIERVLEFWDDSTSQLIKIPLDRLIS